MEHIAIDLGGSQSQVCVRGSDGQVLEERRHKTIDLARYLAKRPPSRVILETCTEAFEVADAARGLGHEVRVVPGLLVRQLGVGSRGVKTDRRDAQVLSEVSCRIDLPSVHIPSKEARERKTMCGMRDAVVSARTQLINTVRGWMRRTARRPTSGDVTTFARRVRQLFGTELPSYVEQQLQVIELLTEQIRQANRELSAIAKADPVCRRLMTVPGEYSSSDYQRRTGITKAGSPSMRWMLVQAAWSARRSRRRGALQQWVDQVEQRRGKRVAVVALARKLAGIMFAIWRDGTTYQPERAANS